MKTLGKLVLLLIGISVLLALLAALSGGWVLWQGGLPGSTALIEMNGDSFDVARLGGGGVLAAMAGLLLALAMVAVVMPAALLIAFAAAGLAVTVAFASVLGVALLLLSPVLLPAALAWWLWRRSERRVTPQSGAAQ